MGNEKHHENSKNTSSIQEFFYGRNVFITGASGFLGKVLLEKLLRSCPGIGIIYLLMRLKRGKTPEERCDAFFNCQLFDSVAKSLPDFRKKICLVDGDLGKPKLGISDEDFNKMKNKVSIVFHGAARLKFNDPLRVASQHHIIAIKDLLEMCQQMPHIVAVVHVSTAFVQREPDLSVLEEIPHCKITPTQLLNAFEWTDENVEEAMSKMLLGDNLNTYIVTKAIGEMAVQEYRKDIPTAIVRPSFISPTYKEPFPGWVDTIQGLSGVFLAASKGVLRTLLAFKGVRANVIPVDVVANTMIASAWSVANEKPSDVLVINCVIDYDKQVTIEESWLPFMMKKREEYPLANFYRYPDFHHHYWRPLYQVHAFFDHWIPAYLCDFLLYIFTGKTILVSVYKRIEYVYGVFVKMGVTPWICRTDNFKKLMSSVSPEESQIFYMDTDDLNWECYLDNCLYKGRELIAKEPPSNIPYARKKAYIWWLVTTILKWIIIFWIIYIMFSRISFMNNLYHHFEERFFAIKY